VPNLHAWSPEFKPRSHQENKTNKNKQNPFLEKIEKK
jgi:hypothetical protein